MQENSSAIVIERTLHGVRKDGSEVSIFVGIGTPVEVSEGEWACPVEMRGISGPSHTIKGADSWQAFQLAYALVVQLLQGFVDAGGSLYFFEPQEQIRPIDLLPEIVS